MDRPRSAAPAPTRSRPRWAMWLALYLAAQTGLLIASGLVRDPARAIVQVVMLGAGTAVVTLATVLRRPRPMTGWLVVVAAGWLVVACVTATIVTYGFGTHTSVRSLVPVILAAGPLPAFGLALGLLSRSVARSGPVDGLDAGMICLCGFLLVWAFVIEPIYVESAASTVMTIIMPASTLFVVSYAVQIVLGGGLRDHATAVLLGAVGLLVALTLLKLVPTLGSGTFRETMTSRYLLSIYGVVVGGIGLLPSFGERRQPPHAATTDLTGQRLALFGLLALVPLAAWMQSARHWPAVTGLVARVVPVAASAAFLALLVTRLSLLARLADQRATDLAFQAEHDPLTGLANRAAVNARLARDLDRAEATGALLILDIDDFKGINDSRGHQVGDALLVQVAQRLQTAAPTDAMVARLGGDEFVVLARNADAGAARILAERIVEAFRMPYKVGDEEFCVTTSIGAVSAPALGPGTYDQALREADIALYAAKAGGRNRYVLR